jgi:hypothetical protein
MLTPILLFSSSSHPNCSSLLILHFPNFPFHSFFYLFYFSAPFFLLSSALHSSFALILSLFCPPSFPAFPSSSSSSPHSPISQSVISCFYFYSFGYYLVSYSTGLITAECAIRRW